MRKETLKISQFNFLRGAGLDFHAHSKKQKLGNGQQ